ncbi:hypothetical protein BPTFM16_01814 [Altererythrobacter insulae]|nr:hypothetical protein BPTFM16_01814 [Altererythrobacter insulae]
MPRLGTGFPAGHRRNKPRANEAVTIYPGPTWDGAAGSGFGSTPSEPVRVTAKPAMQLLVPPLQRYTDKLTIGVIAMANNAGSLYHNCGLNHVLVHFEGITHRIDHPTVQTVIDGNGISRAYEGWWVELANSGTHGECQIYFEAIPGDSSMQSRVIGPFSFFPTAQIHDFEVEVAPSLSVIPNERYQTIKDAAESLRARGADHPRITVTESGVYDLTPVNAAYAGGGYCTIEASAPITLAKSAYQPSGATSSSNGLLRLRYDGLWLRGSNITIDTADLKQFYHENPANPQHVFDGINITDSKGRGALWLMGLNPMPFLGRNTPYYLECNISVTQNACNNAALVRGCTYENGAQDAFSYARCVVGNELNGHHNEDWRAPIDAMIVAYAGSADAATLELSGGSDTNNRVLTIRENGTSVASLQIKNDDAGYVADTHYRVGSIVDWINNLSDWSATLLDNTRRAAALSHSSASSLGFAFGPIDAKENPVTLQTVFDPHGDAWAMNSQSAENSLFIANTMVGNNVPFIFLNHSNLKDIVVANNAGYTDETLNPDYENMVSQWSKSSSHVVVAHNTLANQQLYLRTAIGLTADSYCMLSNNAMLDIDWLGSSDPDLEIEDNHLQSGSTAPDLANGTSIGGTSKTLFVEPASGNFAPTAELRDYSKAARLRRDRKNGSRANFAPAGCNA